MSYLNVFVILFVILISIYLIVNIRLINQVDIAILFIATLVLILTLIINNKKSKETFVDNVSDVESVIDKLKIISVEEDITDIKSRLVVYLTVFNQKSFNNMGKNWNNIAEIKQDGTCPENKTQNFSFELAPVFNRRTGLYLGNNRIICPLSNAFNIQFHNTYTILFACKHGNLLVDNKNNEIEIFKMYANSPNNNGISLFIQKGSLQNNNNTQTGTLMFQYANNEPLMCKVDKDHSYINFDKDVLTFYYIIKDTDNVRILMMNEKSNRIYQILKFNITNTDVTFSNKEAVINRMLNWNGNLFSFAVFDRSISDEYVSVIYTHILNEYIRNIDPNYSGVLSRYNETVALLKSLTKCPFNETICKTCSSVKNWADINQIMNSTSQCKKAINDYCANNVTHPMCKCWDTTSSDYNSETCRIYRQLFSGEKKTSCIDSLTNDDLELIKKKYGLIYPEECPKIIKSPTMIKNTYGNYDWNKLKLDTDENRIRSVYQLDESNDESGISYVRKPSDFTVRNYIKEDENLNKELLAKDSTSKQANEILAQSKKEQTAVLKTDVSPPKTDTPKQFTLLNPFRKDTSSNDDEEQIKSKNPLLITNMFKKTEPTEPVKKPIPTQSSLLTPEKKEQVQDPLANTLPQSDSFFNRFMRVALPTS